MNDNIYKDAIETFGIERQFIVVFEELAELQKELTKHIRGNNNIDKIAEEIADVEIMIEQLKTYFNIHEEVSEHKAKKLIRLSERIEDAGGRRIKAISERPDADIMESPEYRPDPYKNPEIGMKGINRRPKINISIESDKDISDKDIQEQMVKKFTKSLDNFSKNVRRT